MASIPNDEFFGGPSPTEPWPPRPRPAAASVPDVVFYGEARPPAEPGLAQRWATRPVAWGASLFALGWVGILIQLSFVRQLVVGAPVFEEFAKFGLALVAVTVLGARHGVARLPYAWLSGLGFGVFEHFVSYVEEPLLLLLVRAAFHAATAGLSMAVYSLVEPLPDVRMRWVSTGASTILHWGNNFGVVVAVVASAALPITDEVVLSWSLIIIAATIGLTATIVGGESRLRPKIRARLERVFPPLGVTEEARPAGALAQDPPSSEPPREPERRE